MTGGYVLLHRQLLDHPAFRNEAEAMCFAWLVMRASWREVTVRYKGRAITLARGQVAISQRDMAAAFDRDKSWVERLMRRLSNHRMIEATCEAGVSRVTICNYDKYQNATSDSEAANEQSGRQVRGSGEAQNKEGKEGKEEKNPSGSARERAQGSRLPDDWKLTEAEYQWTALNAPGWGVTRINAEADRFRDYWRGVPGAKGRKSDWPGTWRNWIRRTVQDRGGAPPPQIGI